MSLLQRYFEDPKIFSYVILLLYTCNAARWFWHGNIGQGVYWIAAFLITFSVTFLMGAH